MALYTDSLLEREAVLSAARPRAAADHPARDPRRRGDRLAHARVLSAARTADDARARACSTISCSRWSSSRARAGTTCRSSAASRSKCRRELAAPLPVIMGAESEIREALTNLVFNAVDAMPDGGTLTLRTRAADSGYVLVEVTDTGIGMDEDARRRCLEPFFTTKGERGTGLGLAMVYGMVQRHSAEIDIESAARPGHDGAADIRRGVADAARSRRPRPLPRPRTCASCSWTTTRCCCDRCATSSRRMAMRSRPPTAVARASNVSARRWKAAGLIRCGDGSRHALRRWPAGRERGQGGCRRRRR